MVSRLLSVSLIVLGILPFTAPFAAVDSPASVFGHSVAVSDAKPGSSSARNDAAVTIERASFHREAKVAALAVAGPAAPRLLDERTPSATIVGGSSPHVPLSPAILRL